MSGTEVLVSYQLLAAQTSSVLLADRFSCRMADVFATDFQLVAELRTQVVQCILAQEAKQASALPMQNLSSAAGLSASVQLLHRSVCSDFIKAGQLLEHLAVRHRRNAELMAWRSKWHIFQAVYGWSTDGKRNQRDALDFARRAVDADPHNGAGLFDRAFEDWKASRSGKGKTEVIFSAGNTRLEALHGKATITAGKTATFGWQVQADDSTDNCLELWLQNGTATGGPGVTVTVTPPLSAGTSTGHTAPGSTVTSPGPGPIEWMCANISNVVGLSALICLDASKSQPKLAGLWTISVSNNASQTVELHASIERDGKALGSHTAGRKSALVNLPNQPAFVSNETTFSRFGASAGSTSVGAGHTAGAVMGSIQSTQPHTYSGAGPGLSPASRNKPDVIVTVPDAAGQPGLRVRGPFNDSSRMRFGGTSAAAALWAAHRAKALAGVASAAHAMAPAAQKSNA